jgi:hypothetical protein
MLLKQADSKDTLLHDLERLIAAVPVDRKRRIEQELRTVRAGIKGEQDAAYHIDFHLKDRQGWVVIHDLRIEVEERVAQIDHLLLNRFLECYVLETKHFSSGMKITEDGEFLRWNHYHKTYEGMASPLAQNDRHVAVLRDAFDQIEMPTRLGVRLGPSFLPFVLVSPNSRVDRPRKFDTSKVIKADALRNAINARVDRESVFDALGSVARLVSVETLQEVGRQLVALHQPAAFDIAARFGMADLDAAQTADGNPAPTPAVSNGSRDYKVCCRACGSEALAIEYGKYGYYFKCKDCGGNTPIRVSCGHSGHKERLRKEARRFYRECAECRSSSLYFVNPG